MLTEFDLGGRSALVTGAGRGIGKGIAFALADAGAAVGVTTLTPGSADAFTAEMERRGSPGWAWAADSTRVEPMRGVMDSALGAMGGVDILVNCLGDAILGPIAQLPGSDVAAMSEEQWHRVVDLNLTQAYVGCHVFGPHLLARGAPGCVINISSFAALRPGSNMVAYASAKAGLTRFTDSLALEWAPFGVRVNAIAPGSFPDADAMTPEELAAFDAERGRPLPLRRVGHPREVGLMAVYLASSAASYVTGQTFVIDGGRTLR